MYHFGVKQVRADIPLYLWESFIAVIEEKTLQRAALRLKTTQPTITRHLHQLEESLPLKLFELRGRIKEPTPFAEDIYKKINERLRFLPSDVHAALNAFTDKEDHAEISILGVGEAPLLLSTLPFKGKLKLHSVESAELRLRIKAERPTVVLSPERFESADYVFKRGSKHRFHLVVPKKYVRSLHRIEDWDQKFRSFPLGLQSQYQGLFTHYGESKVGFESSDWPALAERASAGLCWTILPSAALKKQQGCHVLPLRPLERGSELHLYIRKDILQRPWAKNLVEQIAKHLSV